jgi:hypothetical protein
MEFSFKSLEIIFSDTAVTALEDEKTASGAMTRSFGWGATISLVELKDVLQPIKFFASYVAL